MGKRKQVRIAGSLEGLLEPKPELEQVVSVIPADVEKEFQAILKAEELSMSKGVKLALSLFNTKFRNSSPKKNASPAKKHSSPAKLIEEFLEAENDARKDLTGKFIGRVPKEIHDEFQAIRKAMKLKIFEATTLSASLLIEYYKEHRKSKRSS